MISLKNVLLINGVSSGITGAALVVLGNFVAGIFGVAQPQPFWAVGVFLVAFAILVISEGLKTSANPKRVQLIITLDITWVVASFLVVVLQVFDISFVGNILITAVGLWVTAMAWLQVHCLKDLPKSY
jgi:hypothetical protein